MLGYIVRRLLGAIPTLFIIVAATFFLMRLAPGGPFDGERRLPPEIERNIKAAYNLDKPVYEQFTIYIDKILTHGDFGPSFKNKDFTVSELIMLGAPVSLMLGLLAITLAVFVGSTLGVTAALRQNTSTDYSVMSLAMIGITIPTFVTAPFLTLILGVYMGGIKEIPDTIFGQGALVGFLVPYVVDMLPLPVAGYGEGAVRNLILPVIVLALPQIAIISRLVRGSMVEVLKSNFVRTAKAKGLTDGQVVWRHAMRAGLLPLVSYLGPAIAGLVTGSLVVEQIFGLPGIGRYFVQGALNRDYTLVMGVVILFATLIITLNLIADIMYRVLDPRVKMDQPFPWVMVGIAAALALLWFTPPGQFVWNQIAGFFTSETVGGALLWAWNALWTGLLWLLWLAWWAIRLAFLAAIAGAVYWMALRPRTLLAVVAGLLSLGATPWLAAILRIIFGIDTGDSWLQPVLGFLDGVPARIAPSGSMVVPIFAIVGGLIAARAPRPGGVAIAVSAALHLVMFLMGLTGPWYAIAFAVIAALCMINFTSAVETGEVKGRSLLDDARRRLLRNRAATVSMGILAVIVLLADWAPHLSVHAYDAQDYNQVGCPPSALIDLNRIDDPTYGEEAPEAALCAQGIRSSYEMGVSDWEMSCGPDAVPVEGQVCKAKPTMDDYTHFLGTDAIGRDLWVRILYGARVSLSVGVVATLVALLIGVLYGATAGYIGGRVDDIMMRFVDVMYALPFIFFVIILMTVTADVPFFKDPFNRFILIFAAIGAVEWLTMARIVRGQTLSIRRKEFVEAAVAAGVGSRAIITRHIIPNVIGPVIVFVTLTIPAIILAESFLSFLGLGVQEPMTSWGVLISEGANEMETKPWMLIFPAAMMAVTLFCFNFIGDGLRDALDPKDR